MENIQQKNRPVRNVKIGGIEVTLWENPVNNNGNNYLNYNYSIKKKFKSNGEWQERVIYIDEKDLIKVRILLDEILKSRYLMNNSNGEDISSTLQS